MWAPVPCLGAQVSKGTRVAETPLAFSQSFSFLQRMFSPSSNLPSLQTLVTTIGESGRTRDRCATRSCCRPCPVARDHGAVFFATVALGRFVGAHCAGVFEVVELAPGAGDWSSLRARCKRTEFKLRSFMSSLYSEAHVEVAARTVGGEHGREASSLGARVSCPPSPAADRAGSSRWPGLRRRPP